MQSIYQRIEALIAERGLTKKAFCAELNISTGNFGDWKRGKTKPSASKLIEIATFFGVSLDWLMMGRDMGKDLIKEQREAYFFDIMGQLNCQDNELAEAEKDFIKEYIEFTRFRKGKLQQADAMEDEGVEDRTVEDTHSSQDKIE